MAEVAQFDPEVVQVFAERLLARARRVVLLWVCLGTGLGFAAMFVVSGTRATDGAVTLVAAVVGAVVGAAIGQARAFTFRLTAQQALWQLAIERHLARMADGQVRSA